jgi:tRNA-splicing ligase RtcB
MLIYPSNDTIIRIYDNEKPNEILNIKRLSELKYVFGYIVILPSYRFNSSFPTCSVIPTKDVLIPNAINKYIGGGVLAYKTDLSLSAVSCTRQGLSASEPQRSASRALAQGLNDIQKTDFIKILDNINEQNFFVELSTDSNGNVWFLVHTNGINHNYDYFLRKSIDYCNMYYSNVPNSEYSFLNINDKSGKDFIKEIDYCVSYERVKRVNIMDNIQHSLGFEILNQIESIDNNITIEKIFKKDIIIHRKNAIKIDISESVLLGGPGQNSYIIKANNKSLNSFNSSSSGSGRRLSKIDAFNTLSLNEQLVKFNDIIINKEYKTLKNVHKMYDAYNNINEIIEKHEKLFDIVDILTPFLIYKK